VIIPLIMPPDGIPMTDQPRAAGYIPRVMGRKGGAWAITFDGMERGTQKGDTLLREMGLAPEDWIGAELIQMSAGPFKSGYSSKAKTVDGGTWLRYRYFADGWHLMDAEKTVRGCGPDAYGYVRLQPTDEQRAKADETWTDRGNVSVGFRN
jgi:hypothetical protein